MVSRTTRAWFSARPTPIGAWWEVPRTLTGSPSTRPVPHSRSPWATMQCDCGNSRSASVFQFIAVTGSVRLQRRSLRRPSASRSGTRSASATPSWRHSAIASAPSGAAWRRSASSACSASRSSSVNGRRRRTEAMAAARKAATSSSTSSVAVAAQPAMLAAGRAPDQRTVARVELLDAVRGLDHFGAGHAEPADVAHHDGVGAARDDAHAAEAAVDAADEHQHGDVRSAHVEHRSHDFRDTR